MLVIIGTRIRGNKLTRTRRNPYEDSLNNVEVTEQSFKEELKHGMERDLEHPACNCEFCQQAHKKFSDAPEDYLEERWQEYLERRNYKPSEEEIARRMEWVKSRGWMK